MSAAPFPLLLLSAFALLAAAPGPQARADDTVTIYRCVDGQGRLTLRDSPCAAGERQQVRTMARPKDAPTRPSAPVAPAAVASAVPQTQVIVVRDPRPLYECVTPDNQRYLSETSEGNPRQVPAWSVGAPLYGAVTTYDPGRIDFRVDDGRVSGNYSSGSFGTVLVPTPAAYGATVWVRDACHALPQADVCDRVRDRRDEVRRRFAIAQPSERAVLGREERSLGARLDQDCR
jgi:hypothetical protein